MARWQSGHAAACKAVYAGSIPTRASTPNFIANPCAGSGFRACVSGKRQVMRTHQHLPILVFFENQRERIDDG
jgi:hypothetical protein